VGRWAIKRLRAVDKPARLWITRGQDAAAVALDDEVLDDDEFDVLDDFALESDEDEDAADDDVEPPSDAAAPALALPSEPSDLLSVR
jgi:hypothetical protein